MIEPGIYKDLSNKDYHADAAISRSGIILCADSPYRYWANYLNPNRPEKKEKDVWKFGTAFHTCILEPDLFKNSYVCFYGNKRTKKGKQEYEELIKSGKIILTNQDMELLNLMKQSLQGDRQAWELITNADYETSYFWKDTQSELMVKTRPDILHSNMIVDLKTITSAQTNFYRRAMSEDGYHIQGAMVQDGVYALTGRFIDTVINVCVEKTYPYAIGIKIISEEALEAGRKKYKENLLRMKECFVSNVWPSYDIETVDLPPWSV